MLKQLKLNAELRKKRIELDALTEKRSEAVTKADELRTALEEAKDEEEVRVVQDEIDELEKTVGEHLDEQIQTLSGEIKALEDQLTEIEVKSKEAADDQTKPDETKTERTRINMINKRSIFYTLDAQTRQRIVEREDVKEFITRTKASFSASQTRTVTNAELEVPEILMSLIKENTYKYSKLLGKVRVVPVKGKARQPIMGTIPEAVWTESIANFNDMSISLNEVEVDAYKCAGFTAIPNSIIEDTDEEFLAAVIEYLTAGVGKAVDRAILFGTGNRMPLGIATRLAQTAKPSTWGAKAPTWTDLHTSHVIKLDINALTGAAFFSALCNALAVAEPKHSLSGERFWCVNRKTAVTIRAKAMAFDSAAALKSTVDKTMPFDGGELIELDFIADNDIIGGYGDAYTYAERSGMTLTQSGHALFLQDQTAFAVSSRGDGVPVAGESFVAVNFANTNITTASTFAGDSANADLVSLSALTIGTTPVTLYPPFNKDVLNYHAEVTAHSQKIVATALKSGAVVSIKKGTTAVTSGNNATFTAGENTLTVDVTNGNATKRTYTVIVNDVTE